MAIVRLGKWPHTEPRQITTKNEPCAYLVCNKSSALAMELLQCCTKPLSLRYHATAFDNNTVGHDMHTELVTQWERLSITKWTCVWQRQVYIITASHPHCANGFHIPFAKIYSWCITPKADRIKRSLRLLVAGSCVWEKSSSLKPCRFHGHLVAFHEGELSLEFFLFITPCGLTAVHVASRYSGSKMHILEVCLDARLNFGCPNTTMLRLD